MKRRILASVICLCLLVGLLPTAALAEEGESLDGAVCTCTALCTEDSVDENCPVCVEDWTACGYTQPEDSDDQQQGGMEPEDPEGAVCTCTALCAEDSVDTTCPVCAADWTVCGYIQPEGDQQQGGTEPEDPEGPVCTCTALCAEDSVDTTCPVCAADWTACGYTQPEEDQQEGDFDFPSLLADYTLDGTEYTVTDLDSFQAAVEDIKGRRDGEESLAEATIVFTEDITFDYDCHTEGTDHDSKFVGRNYFSGIEGVTLTLTSESKPVTLKNLGATFGSTRLTNAGFNTNDQNARFFTGPLVLDNIKLQTSERDFFFAQGYPLVITENFQSTSRISLVGGCLGIYKRLDGMGFDSGLFDMRGNAYTSEDDQWITSTHLEIYGGEYKTIIGGGYNSDIVGTFDSDTLSYNGGTYVKIQLDGEVTVGNSWYEVANVYGGSYVRRNSSNTPSEGTSGKISGDTEVEVVSGAVATIWGGSNNLYTSNKGQGVIIGDAYVTVGTDSGAEAVCQNVYGGGSYSTVGQEDVRYNPEDPWASANVGGNTYVTINASTRGRGNVGDPNGNIHAGGDCDIINGTTNLTLNGGSGFDWVFAGGANRDYEQKTEINNMHEEKNAATITINGGTWDEIYSGVHTWMGSGDADSKQKINGNVFVEFNDGEVNLFCLSSYMVSITGDSILSVKGGKFGSSTYSIAGYGDGNGVNDTDCVSGSTIVNIENSLPTECWLIYFIDQINVNNTETFFAKGTYNGSLRSCGSVNIQSGTLALTGTNNISGNFTIAEGGTIALNGTDSTITTPGCVNAAGTATGTGGLLVFTPSASSATGWIKTDGTPQLPNVGEVYLRSKTTNETATAGTDANLLDLKNSPSQGRYVEYTTDSSATDSYSHAWRIAQGQVQEVTWYYEVYYQNPDGSFERWKNAQGGTEEESTVVSISHDRFDGIDLGWEDITGGQNEKLGVHYVFDETNPYNWLSAAAGAATRDNPLKIYYKCAPHKVTYEYDSSAPAGAVLPEEETNHYYSEKNVTPATPTAVTGYTFLGWQVQSPSDLTIGADGTFTMPNADVVLVGNWEPNAPADYPLTYSANYGTPAETKDGGTHAANESVTLLGADAFTREGYRLVGWNTETNGNGTTYPLGGAFTMPAAEVTLYAQWEQQYQVTYDANGGDPASVPTDDSWYSPGDTVTVSSQEPTWEGHTFIGWKYGDAIYQEDGIFPMPAADITLYAQWEQQYQVTYDANGGDPASVPTDDSWYSPGDTVTVSSQEPTWEGHTFIGWKYGDTVYQGNSTFTMPAENIILYAQWEQQHVTIRPADITIYMGGEDGYEGALDSNHEIVSTDSLPVPGFVVTLPEGLAGVDVTELTLQYQEDDALLQWQFTKYGGGNHNIYRIDPREGTDTRPVRMVFTNAAGETVTDDQFVITDHLEQKLTMEVYGEGIQAGAVFVVYDGVSYPITTGDEPATLTVRGTTNEVEYGGIHTEAAQVPKGASGVVAPVGTTYTINDSPVQVDDTSGIALLFDGIIENNDIAGTGNTDLLTQRAEEILAEMEDTGLSGRGDRRYEARYLDLVDTNNGNAWVAASQDITVYWPLPEGTDRRTDFVLLHFEGLHREMGTSAIPNAVDHCTVTDMDIQVTRNHITFTVTPGNFSPFLLVWDKDEPSRPTRPDDDKADTPELNTEDHCAYIVGYEDGTVRPEGYLTRAEVATIFFRLLTDASRERFWTTRSDFSDVTRAAWYNNAIATMTNAGILKGYEDDTFHPNANITRAEFAAIAARFDDSATEIDSGFTDIAGHWAEMEICRAVSLGWIQGYEDGTFRPDQPITRAEVMTIVNRMLDRAPEDEADLLPDMNVWSDNLPGTWYYLAVQEATNSHTYVRKNNGYETWVVMLEDPDWTQYQ